MYAIPAHSSDAAYISGRPFLEGEETMPRLLTFTVLPAINGSRTGNDTLTALIRLAVVEARLVCWLTTSCQYFASR
jgi:hypothetical protein